MSNLMASCLPGHWMFDSSYVNGVTVTAKTHCRCGRVAGMATRPARAPRIIGDAVPGHGREADGAFGCPISYIPEGEA